MKIKHEQVKVENESENLIIRSFHPNDNCPLKIFTFTNQHDHIYQIYHLIFQFAVRSRRSAFRFIVVAFID